MLMRQPLRSKKKYCNFLYENMSRLPQAVFLLGGQGRSVYITNIRNFLELLRLELQSTLFTWRFLVAILKLSQIWLEKSGIQYYENG